MRLLVSLALVISLTAISIAQDISNGSTALPNRTIVNQMYPDCSVSDAMHTFYNLREQCDVFPDFRNGEKRLLTKDVQTIVLPLGESRTVDGFGQTACAAGGDATWIRNFFSAEDAISWYVSWDLTWIPRRADNSFDTANKKTFEWNKCRVYKTVAQTGCITFDDGRCDTGAPKTPIVLDMNDDNVVELTDREHGVAFDLDMNGERERRAWLANGDDAWLVLAYNADGSIRDGRQLFGPGDKDNGYLHLAAFDDNRDGLISSLDGIWSSLAAWRDLNHNGLSESGELTYLPDSGISWLSLDFKKSRHRDRYGNEFRYRARMGFTDGREGRSFDVILK